jgi:hypothetical protein
MREIQTLKQAVEDRIMSKSVIIKEGRSPKIEGASI